MSETSLKTAEESIVDAAAGSGAIGKSPDLTDHQDKNPNGVSDPDLWSSLRLLGASMLLSRKGLPAIKLGSIILVVLIANMIGQVRLNAWNGAFFNAVEQRDVSAFLHELLNFVFIAGSLLALVVAQTWLQERLKIRIRERLSQVLMDAWLRPNRPYQMSMSGPAGGQPDQRMQEDSRLFAELSTELGIAMLQASLLLVSFIGVLWSLSSYAVFTFRGEDVRIPGYMVWVAIGYAGLGSGLTWIVGRPLIPLNTKRYAREADLRFALVRVNESAESVAFYSGEAGERRNLDIVLNEVLRSTRKLSGALARLTWITSGYGWLALVVPVVAAAPGYFSGRLNFGEMMMVVGAFSQVQTALRYFVDNFPKFADWRSAVHRVGSFHAASLDFEAAAKTQSQITLQERADGDLQFEQLSIALSDGSIILEEATAKVTKGERVLITGESGSGKSTLFRAIAGLWPWGTGVIQTPPGTQMMFLPQRPYLPLGSLRDAVCYPAHAETFLDSAVRGALERCAIGEFGDMLDTNKRWDMALSLGQQQRVAFARLLLHKPNWVFMDEATSALDDENQLSMLQLFDEELAGCSVLSIGHRPGLEKFHNRTISIRKTSQGAVLAPVTVGRGYNLSGRLFAGLRRLKRKHSESMKKGRG